MRDILERFDNLLSATRGLFKGNPAWEEARYVRERLARSVAAFEAMQDALRNLTNGLDLGWERGYFDPMARKAVDAAHEKARAVIAEADAICTTL